MSAQPIYEEHPMEPKIPDFEGKSVDMAKIKIAAVTDLDCEDAVVRMDDIVRIVVEARVSQVHHNVNERTGQLVRLQTVKPLSVEIAPWNPEEDHGVV